MSKKGCAALTDRAVDLVARDFAALASPMRLRLVGALIEGRKNVSTLVEETGSAEPNISRHLQTLTRAGLIIRKKEGVEVFYSLADPSVCRVCELIRAMLEKQLANQADLF